MFKNLKNIQYCLFGLIIFYVISTSLFVVSPFMSKNIGFIVTDQNPFNAILMFVMLFLVINLTISIFIFLIESWKDLKINIIIGIFTISIAIIFSLIQWGLISLANVSASNDSSLILKNLFLALILNLILCLFYNEFLKTIIILGNKNKPAECFIVSNWSMFLFKNKYILINNNVLLTYNKWKQVDIIMFDQLEEKILDFGGEERKVLNKSLSPETKDLMDEFQEEKTTIIYTKPNDEAIKLNKYVSNIGKKIESPVLCLLVNSGIYVPILKGKVPSNIKIAKKVQLKGKIKDNLIKGTKLSFKEIGEKI